MQAKKILRLALAATALLSGLAQSAQATTTIQTFTGDTTGAPSYLRTEQDGSPGFDWRGYTTYRAYDVDVKEQTDVILMLATCAFDCSMLVYKGAFDPADPAKNFFRGDDTYVSYNTAALMGTLAAGHYTLLIAGAQTGASGYFSTTITSTNAFAVTAVPEPSAYLMLGAGLALLGLRRRRQYAASSPTFH